MSQRDRISGLDFDDRPLSGIFTSRNAAARPSSPPISSDVLEAGLERMSANPRQVVHQMCSHKRLSLFEPREFMELVDECEIVRCGGGTVMVQAEAPANSVFFVLKGEVFLQGATSTGVGHRLRVCADDGVFGVEGVFAEGTYGYKARAVRNTAALRFRASGLRNFVQRDDIIASRMLYTLASLLSEQLWESTQSMVHLLQDTSMRMTLNSARQAHKSSFE